MTKGGVISGFLEGEIGECFTAISGNIHEGKIFQVTFLNFDSFARFLLRTKRFTFRSVYISRERERKESNKGKGDK